ncbi:hypothetical protein ABT336_26140, partial [Micromonospora sp. NPDC000207]|uniref:hypothetical protein n=1 Tax=Micromonospora sp. NPDC000207 TaxID=3154246 RepID=UPI003326091F
MSAPVSAPERRPPSLLTVLFWAGVALAPVAALILLVAESNGPLRVAAVLAIGAVVLIGLSITLRADGGAAGVDPEQAQEELDDLRRELRSEIVAAAQRGNQALDQAHRAQEAVAALRRRLDDASAPVAAAPVVAASAAAPVVAVPVAAASAAVPVPPPGVEADPHGAGRARVVSPEPADDVVVAKSVPPTGTARPSAVREPEPGSEDGWEQRPRVAARNPGGWGRTPVDVAPDEPEGWGRAARPVEPAEPAARTAGPVHHGGPVDHGGQMEHGGPVDRGGPVGAGRRRAADDEAEPDWDRASEGREAAWEDRSRPQHPGRSHPAAGPEYPAAGRPGPHQRPDPRGGGHDSRAWPPAGGPEAGPRPPLVRHTETVHVTRHTVVDGSRSDDRYGDDRYGDDRYGADPRTGGTTPADERQWSGYARSAEHGSEAGGRRGWPESDRHVGPGGDDRGWGDPGPDSRYDERGRQRAESPRSDQWSGYGEPVRSDRWHPDAQRQHGEPASARPRHHGQPVDEWSATQGEPTPDRSPHRGGQTWPEQRDRRSADRGEVPGGGWSGNPDESPRPEQPARPGRSAPYRSDAESHPERVESYPDRESAGQWSEARAGDRWAEVRDDERGREVRVGQRHARMHADADGGGFRVEDRWSEVRHGEPPRQAGHRDRSGPPGRTALPAGWEPVPH